MAAENDWPALAALAYPGYEPPAASGGEPVPGSGGQEKCTATAKQTARRCGRWPVPGATVCRVHGGGAPQVKDAAARRVQEREAVALARRTIGGIDLSAYSDPFSALEFAVSYSHAMAERLAKIVTAIPDDQLRYQGKIGEQLRGEVTACQKALSDLRAAATDSLKLGLAERRARISERQVDLIERALNAALTVAGLDLEGQDKAIAVLRRELKAADAIEAAQDA